MPIYNASLTTIDINETRRYAGLTGTGFSLKIVEEACTEAQILAKPQGIWQIYPYDAPHHTILGAHSLTLSGSKITSHLQRAKKVAILALTIGATLENTVTLHFKQGEYTAGLLLDAAGTTAVETAADQLELLLKQKVLRDGYETIFRFSPGYGDWDIAVQAEILALSGGIDIGVHVTTSSMLTPRKSITAIIGLIPRGTSTTAQTTCANEPCKECTQPHCLARKETN